MPKFVKSPTELIGRCGAYDCPQCHKPRMNVMSGSVCPHGCDGKILAKVPKEIDRLAEAIVRHELVPAVLVTLAMEAAGTTPPVQEPDEPRYKTNNFWIFEGLLWRKVRTSAQDKRPKSDRMVLDPKTKRLIQITPWREANVVLLKSMAEAAKKESA